MGEQRWILSLILITAAAAPSAAPQAAAPPPPPSSTAEEALTLDQAFALAAANNRTITAARLRRALNQAGIDVAIERPNPDLRDVLSKETAQKSLTAAHVVELGDTRGRRIPVAREEARIGAAE